MSKIEVNQISSQCGSTLTIGQSGDTVTLASGATQTGFGRTGTVDWDTTAKTTGFTAVSGTGYFINTSSGAITMTLPSSPSSGDIVSFKDYANTFDTNNLTIARNGSPIGGSSADATISVEGQSGTLIYVDGTKGWLIVNAATDADLPAPAFVTATGGTVSCCGDYKIHTFTGPGTFTVTCAGNTAGSNTVDYLVIAGGGGGAGGGGAGGGFRESKATGAPWTASPLATCTSLPVTATGYPITVGGGGALNVNTSNPGTNGSPSIFSTITSAGGGYGGGGGPGTTRPGNPGGSGGGAWSYNNPTSGTGGTGNTPPVAPPQGNNGGPIYATPCGAGAAAGGGGAGGVGVIGGGGDTGNPTGGGAGGPGVSTSISTSPVTYASGGKGYASAAPGPEPANSGNGGGGGPVGGAGVSGNNGGSGIVIIRYKYQ